MRNLSIAVICLSLLLQIACGNAKEPKPRSLSGRSEHRVTHQPDDKRPIVLKQAAPAAPLERKHPLPSPSTTLLPTKLEIPAIHLKTKVEPVGLLPDGAMDVPKAFDRVGLLYPAVLPGQTGNAVIDGHVDHYTGPAVFFYLKRLQRGDHLIVTDKQGQSLTFVVSSVESFKTREAPLGRIFGPADRPRLNLITCTGKFNKKTQEHAKRLVVFSELRSSYPKPMAGSL